MTMIDRDTISVDALRQYRKRLIKAAALLEESKEYLIMSGLNKAFGRNTRLTIQKLRGLIDDTTIFFRNV